LLNEFKAISQNQTAQLDIMSGLYRDASRFPENGFDVLRQLGRKPMQDFIRKRIQDQAEANQSLIAAASQSA
jgi:hypothetical protein